jgi:hypothetical protein
MHFQRIMNDPYGDNDDDYDDALNPASLLSVVEALVELTGGLPIDPASGAIMS